MAMNNYEAVVILNPLLTEAETDALIERLGGILTSGGATIRETARWGRRRLAFPINKRNDGFYVIFYFTLEKTGDVLTAFERACRFDENIVREMTVKVPSKKRGQEIAQLVPAPGYLADFRLEPRAHRRRDDRDRDRDRDRGPRPDYHAPAPTAPAAEGAAETQQPAPSAGQGSEPDAGTK